MRLSIVSPGQAKAGLGLISKGQRDKKLDIEGIFYCNKYKNNTNKIVKGNELQVSNTFGAQNFEVQVNLSKKYWRVATTSFYENIFALKEFYQISPNESYHFYFALSNSSSIDIYEISEVAEFNTEMK